MDMRNNLFCMIENGIIYQVDTYNKVAIGHTNDVVNELNSTLDEYYSKLVELGVITPPKTQEEINAEMQQALKESQELNIQLANLVKELKLNGGNSNEQADNRQGGSNVSKSKHTGQNTGSSTDSKPNTAK